MHLNNIFQHGLGNLPSRKFVTKRNSFRRHILTVKTLLIQKCDKKYFRKCKQNDPEINFTFHLFGGYLHTGCTTTYIDTTNTLTHRPIQLLNGENLELNVVISRKNLQVNTNLHKMQSERKTSKLTV